MHCVTIYWTGLHEERTYNFNNDVELNNFMMGVAETAAMCGGADYRVLYDSREAQREDLHPVQ